MLQGTPCQGVHWLTSQIDRRSWDGVRGAKIGKILFERKRQVDIRDEVHERAKAAGEVDLDHEQY